MVVHKIYHSMDWHQSDAATSRSYAVWPAVQGNVVATLLRMFMTCCPFAVHSRVGLSKSTKHNQESDTVGSVLRQLAPRLSIQDIYLTVAGMHLVTTSHDFLPLAVADAGRGRQPVWPAAVRWADVLL